MLQRELLYAALGTGFTCLATVLGAAMVFFFKKGMSHTMQKVFLGFAAGVMIAASVWSLLIPAMEMVEERGQSVLLPVGGGFLLGGVFLLALDHLLPHLHLDSDEAEGRMSAVLQENLTGVRVVRAFGQQQREVEKFDRASADFRHKTKHWSFRLGMPAILAVQIVLLLVLSFRTVLFP